MLHPRPDSGPYPKGKSSVRRGSGHIVYHEAARLKVGRDLMRFRAEL